MPAIIANSDQEFERVLQYIMEAPHHRRMLARVLRNQLASHQSYPEDSEEGRLLVAAATGFFLGNVLQEFLSHQKEAIPFTTEDLSQRTQP